MASKLQQIFTENMDLFKVLGLILVIGAIVYYLKFSDTVDKFSTGFHSWSDGKQDRLLVRDDDEVKEVSGNQDFGMTAAMVPRYTENKGEEVKPEELLPKTEVRSDLEKAFAEDKSLASSNFLTAGFTAGINTVQSSLKNPNLDIRSAPVIPVDQKVSPWNVSTYEPDLHRRPLE